MNAYYLIVGTELKMVAGKKKKVADRLQMFSVFMLDSCGAFFFSLYSEDSGEKKRNKSFLYMSVQNVVTENTRYNHRYFTSMGYLDHDECQTV